MTKQDDSARNVCHNCIGDDFLATEVVAKGMASLCGYCGQTQEAQPLEALAMRIHEVLHEHFECTPGFPLEGYEYYLAREGQWEREGYPVADVIAGMAGVSEKIAGDITDVLSDIYDSPGYYEAVKYGGDLETAYGSDDYYEERRPDDRDFRGMWTEVRNEIGSRARFFNAAAEEMLGSIFQDLERHQAPSGRPVVRHIGPGKKDGFVWRARVAQTANQIRRILESPTRELGPPPSHLARGGRMNAPGIPVFYGGMEMPTCVAEVQAPVGSHVVVAKFELLRTMRLLDLEILEEVYVEGSCFDPDYTVRKARATFLKRLASEISQPVMPQDESLEYLPTQVVAEFLANKATPHLDGIIYRSSQTGGDGHNVVLFSEACGVAPYSLPPRTELTIHVPRPLEEDDDDEDRDILVIEHTESASPSEPPAPDNHERPGSSIHLSNYASMGAEDASEGPGAPSSHGKPALHLDLDSLVVLDIEGATYDYRPLAVRRIRLMDQQVISISGPGP